jgi:predicted  nucleic acid-binding Zn-ribbon protein
MSAELDHLDERIRAAASLVARLREEKRRLEAETKELRERVRALDSAAAKHVHSDALKPRLKELEQERSTLLDERRVMARRLEEMLGKLELLSKAVQA